jgi:phosphoribosylanthranilate isomerase
MILRVKVSGVTSVGDARAFVEMGVDAIGVSLSSRLPGCVENETAREIVRAVGQRTLVVAEIADLEVGAAKDLRDDVGVGCLELAGDEAPAMLGPLLPHAYKAMTAEAAADVAYATSFPGVYLLARGPEAEGFNWGRVAPLAGLRRLTIAGGLTAGNVAEAVRVVRPYAVEVACTSGAAGVDAVGRFVRAVHELRGRG